eukprot:Amastigsp_a677380_13.p4 type:complete len:128 gc:universal Amastigsp_a677380_13:1979-1596(-)
MPGFASSRASLSWTSRSAPSRMGSACRRRAQALCSTSSWPRPRAATRALRAPLPRCFPPTRPSASTAGQRTVSMKRSIAGATLVSRRAPSLRSASLGFLLCLWWSARWQTGRCTLSPTVRTVPVTCP